MNENKFHEVDKAVTKTVMSEFVGEVVDTVCCDCLGAGVLSNDEKCTNCNGEGHYDIEY